MSDESKPTVAVDTKPSKAVVVENFDLTLDEFCQRASAEPGASPELIAGFHFEQKSAGVIKNTAAGFASAFSGFAKKPA